MIAIDLRNKTAVITGGGQGLGKATTTLLHRAGANVVINYFEDTAGENQRRAERLAEELGDDRAIAWPGDVRLPEAMDRLMDGAIASFGGLDLIICNAGILRDRTARKMTREEWQDVIDTNLTGVFNTCQAAIPRMNDGGRLVMMGSVSGVIGFFGQANYAAAKAGVMTLAKVLAKELAVRQITVNAVAPGVVLTEMGQSIPEPVQEGMLSQIPLRRFGEPEEIAGAILFLCSDLASYVTGQTLHVNGGWWG